MTSKNKIEKYVKAITKHETYVKYLTDAANFGYNLRENEVNELKAALKAYEDIGEKPLDFYDLEDTY